MIYICQQPRIPYFSWMIEAMLYQNQEIGMDLSDFHILCGYSYLQDELTNHPDVIANYKRLEQRFPKAKFFYYLDDRNPITYIPSVIPNLLKKHFSANRWLEKEAVFLTDCDQLFITKPDYSDLLKDDNCYVSDSRGFINHSYLTYGNRPKHIVDDLESLVGLQPGEILAQNDNSGGSHYLVKNVNAGYFSKVETDANKIYDLILAYNGKYDQELGAEKFYGLQAWGALMWSLLYNLWYIGREVRITDRLAFCWGSDTIERWYEREIFHNAGVSSALRDSHNMFYKADYTQTLPYDDVNTKEFNPKFASSKYAEILKEVGKDTCLRFNH